jgi:hypothetical protein
MQGDQNVGGNKVADFRQSSVWHKNCLTFGVMFLINNCALATVQAEAL